MDIKKIGKSLAMGTFVFVTAFVLTSQSSWRWGSKVGLAYAADACGVMKKTCSGTCDPGTAGAVRSCDNKKFIKKWINVGTPKAPVWQAKYGTSCACDKPADAVKP